MTRITKPAGNRLSLYLLLSISVGIPCTFGATTEVGDATGTAASAATSEEALQEVVVTAEKRTESINKVGLSVVALSGDELTEQGIRDVASLAEVVPGFTYTNSFTNTPVYSIRGVGFYETTLSAYPDVSVYVDQVPLPFPALTSMIGQDLERVEVLKGPQGILFGQNSTGGAINYVAAKPTMEFGTGMDLSYGRFNDVALNGFANAPITPELLTRISFQIEHADPWQHSYYLPVGGENGAVSKFGARLLTDWAPTDALRFQLAMNLNIDQSQPSAPQYIAVAPQHPGKNADALIAYPRAPADPQAADFSPANVPSSNNRMEQISLRADYDFLRDLTLTSISSYVHYRRDEKAEYGGTASEADELTVDLGYITSLFQELRIANVSKRSLRWLVGANYDHSQVNDYNALNFSGGTTQDTLGITSNPFYSDQTMNNYAAFGNADYELSSSFTLKAGVRYTESDRRAVSCTLGGDGGGVDALFDQLTSAIHGGQVFPPLQKNDCISFDPATLLPMRVPYVDNLDEHNVSWRVGTDYRPTEDSLVYFNVSKGYKAGSFPTATASTAFQLLPVKQESVLAYELGFKLSLLDHSLRLNGAGFHYDYTDKQIRSQTVQPIFGLQNNLVNVPRSRVDGGELEISWVPLRGLHLSAAATYLNARITSYEGFNGGGVFSNFAGDAFPYTPKLTLSGVGDYRWSLSRKVDAFFGATVSSRSTAEAVIGPAPIDKLNPYVLLNLRAGIESQDGRLRLELWGKNVTNKYYWNNIVHVYDTVVRYAEQPVTYGILFSERF